MVAIELGSVITGKYRLERPLARGGMGSVWIGRHLELGNTVAIKFIDSAQASSDSARTRFKREAKAAAQLKMSHVVQVYDYGVQDETPYIVMELLEGEDLGARLKREGRLSLAAAAAIIASVCKALHRAHDLGLVHRDLKPANIFLARQDDEVVVKVLDFGIAKWSDPNESGDSTKSGTMIGSPFYMSPEQARSLKDLDHRSDLWSLGVIAFQALTGQLPFSAISLPSVIMAICADPIPVASAVAPDLDLGPEIDQFFRRALSRDPAQRFQSARELAEAFTALAALEAGASGAAASVGGAGGIRSVSWSSFSFSDSSPSPIAAKSVPPAVVSERASGVNTLSPTGASLIRPPAQGHHLSLVMAASAAAGVFALTLFGLSLWSNAASTSAAVTATPSVTATLAEPKPTATATATAKAPPTPPAKNSAPSSSAAASRAVAGVLVSSRATPAALSTSANVKPPIRNSAATPSSGPRVTPGTGRTAPTTMPAPSGGHGIY